MGGVDHPKAAAIRWGIFGVGAIAHRFAADLKRVEGARLTAVASRSAERAQSAAKAMGAERGIMGRAALLSCTDVDVVYIATPTHSHKNDCLAALAAGKHVLCEKPLAMTATEAEEIAAAARAAGRFCMEALWTQFIPALTEAERLLASGAIGSVQMFQASFGLCMRTPDDLAPMPDGGALLDLGCYPISLALRLFGEVRSVHAEAVTSAAGADLTASAVLRFEGGEIAVVSSSITAGLENRVFISGAEGSLALNDVACPTLITLRPWSAGPAGRSPTQACGLKRRLREGLRLAVRQSRLLTRLRALWGPRSRGLPCRGFGLTHEIEEVHACLRAGLQESEIHPLSRSVETLRIIDTILGLKLSARGM